MHAFQRFRSLSTIRKCECVNGAREGIPEAVRYAAAVDLAHAARVAGNLDAFRRAKRAVLRFATQADWGDVAERMAKLWPEDAPGRVGRAS